MLTESKAAFARRLKVNKSTITRAEQAGRLVMVDGRVDVEASLLLWAKTRGGRTDVEARHAADRGAVVLTPSRGFSDGVAAVAGGATPDATSGDGEPARADWKSMSLDYENKLTRLELDLRRGRSHAVSAVTREAQALGATLRAAIERVIDQTAPRLAVSGDPLVRRRIVEDELKKLRRLVKGEFPRSLRRIRASGRKVSAGATAKDSA